jgi:RNA polymerase primary sigma factor
MPAKKTPAPAAKSAPKTLAADKKTKASAVSAKAPNKAAVKVAVKAPKKAPTKTVAKPVAKAPVKAAVKAAVKMPTAKSPAAKKKAPVKGKAGKDAPMDDIDLSGIDDELSGEVEASSDQPSEKAKPLRMKISKAKERALMKEFGLDETVLSEEEAKTAASA